jgi:ABC-type multidrug transport system permease subunit
MLPMRLALALLFALATGGCGAGPIGTLALSWRFADGRSCLDAGAATVQGLVGGSAIGEFACSTGEPPLSAMVMNATAGATLEVVALSPARVELYRGTLETDAKFTPATVTLYATGAR